MEKITSRISKLTGTCINNLTILSQDTLVLEQSNSVNILFGPLSSMSITWHDIIITPENTESYVNVKIILDGYSTEFTTNEPIDIIQRPCKSYPSFELEINSNPVHTKKYLYEGVICVNVVGGSCQINKFDQMIIDH